MINLSYLREIHHSLQAYRLLPNQKRKIEPHSDKFFERTMWLLVRRDEAIANTLLILEVIWLREGNDKK